MGSIKVGLRLVEVGCRLPLVAFFSSCVVPHDLGVGARVQDVGGPWIVVLSRCSFGCGCGQLCGVSGQAVVVDRVVQFRSSADGLLVSSN
jgi:hypothetical protein